MGFSLQEIWVPEGQEGTLSPLHSNCYEIQHKTQIFNLGWTIKCTRQIDKQTTQAFQDFLSHQRNQNPLFQSCFNGVLTKSKSRPAGRCHYKANQILRDQRYIGCMCHECKWKCMWKPYFNFEKKKILCRILFCLHQKEPEKTMVWCVA